MLQENIEQALYQAEQKCKRSGARLTSLRAQILKLMFQAHRPIGAYELMEALQACSSRTHVAPPTVYRSLSFLHEQGLIYKIHSLNAFIARRHPLKNNSCALFICSQCHHTEEIYNQAMEQAINLSAAQQRFTVTAPIIEIQGICKACSKKNMLRSNEKQERLTLNHDTH